MSTKPDDTPAGRPVRGRRLVVVAQQEPESSQSDVEAQSTLQSEESARSISRFMSKTQSIQMLPTPDVDDLLPKRARNVHVMRSDQQGSGLQGPMLAPHSQNNVRREAVQNSDIEKSKGLKGISVGVGNSVTKWVNRTFGWTRTEQGSEQQLTALNRSPLQASEAQSRLRMGTDIDLKDNGPEDATVSVVPKRSSQGPRSISPARNTRQQSGSARTIVVQAQETRESSFTSIAVSAAEALRSVSSASSWSSGHGASTRSSTESRSSRRQIVVVQQSDSEADASDTEPSTSAGVRTRASRSRSSRRRVQTPGNNAPPHRRPRDIVIQPNEGDTELASIASNINALFLQSSAGKRPQRSKRGQRVIQGQQNAESLEEASELSADRQILSKQHGVKSGRIIHKKVVVQRIRDDSAELDVSAQSAVEASAPQNIGEECVTTVENVGSVEHIAVSEHTTTTQGPTNQGLPLEPANLEERWRRERIRASRTDRQFAVDGAPNLQLLEMHHTRRFDDDVWGAEEPWEDR